MKLTTPATASLPYTADAPSFSTSTRSIIVIGIVAMSTALLPAAGATRRPLISTSVRAAPSPRSEISETEPVPPLPAAGARVGDAGAAERRRGGDLLEQLFGGRHAEPLDVVAREDLDRQRGLALDPLDRRAGHLHAFELRFWCNGALCGRIR